jgi:N-glycosylase/DNA lyase
MGAERTASALVDHVSTRQTVFSTQQTDLSTRQTSLAARPPYHLLRTLSCGQAFGWRIVGDGATGIFGGRRVRLEQRRNVILVEGIEERAAVEALANYLGLDQPLRAIERELTRDRILNRILPHTSGIAILRQDPWECLAAFIISAFNNIPKVELTIVRLSERFGEPVRGGGHAFPPAAVLADAPERALRQCVLGYRAPYLRAVARLVDGGRFDLGVPFTVAYDDAKRKLLELPGVGQKVADCVLLFAYGKGESFPVDTWVKRAVERWYFRGEIRTEREIRVFARRRFGELAGYAQQHLFYHARSYRPNR